MITPLRSFLRHSGRFVLVLLGPLLLPTLAPAAALYWDSNGTTAGAGVTPTGTWGTSAFWSTDSSGLSATANTTTAALDILTFSAGTDATGSPTITVNGTQGAQLLSIEEGAVTFSGGTIALGAAGGVTLAAAAGNATISSNLGTTDAQTFNVGTGRTLALNTGTFTRATGSVLNVQGAGTVTSTMTNLSTNNSAGMIGAWASIGTGASTKYAKFTGSTITSLTGTAAANVTNLTDTTGLVNYDLADFNGTVPATVSANTIRYTGTSGGSSNLGATSFTVNGIMNVGTAFWGLNLNKVTIGANKELVLNPANSSITIFSTIQDNAGGASAMTITAGTGIVQISGANTYTGTTTIATNGYMLFNGSLSTSSAIVNNGTLQFVPSTTMTQGTNFGSVISGTGAIVAGGSTGTTVLNGTNTYTGGTQVSQGTVSVSNIGDAGVAGNLGQGTFVLLGGGTLRYTGASAGTNRNFFLSAGTTSTVEVTTNTLTVSGATGVTTGGLTKTGAGTLILAATNLYTGATTVSAGTLLVSGGISGSTTTVSSTGTLGGSGGTTGAVIVNSGGTLAPGTSASTGTLNTGAITLNANGIFHLALNTSTAAVSKANATGGLSLDNTATLSITDLGANVTLTIGTVLPFIDYSGTWNGGTFLGHAENSIFSIGANQFRIKYDGVDGSTPAVTLTAMGVPEPGSAALLGAGTLLLAVHRRRRNVRR